MFTLKACASKEEAGLTQLHTINGAVFKEMILTGAALLEHNKALVDSLNVFPVPDGDTGTNMSMTISSAVRELKNLEEPTVSSVAQAVSKGALRGARGNSGVILSQLFRGMARALEGKESMDAKAFAAALAAGSEAAYKAVMKPKEGTILTVARVVAEEAVKTAEAGANIYKLVDGMISDGDKILAKTPDMLPVLKEAGVVDSGGKGLLFVYRGFKMALDGDSVEDYSEEIEDASSAEMEDREENVIFDSLEEIQFGYCTEFFIEQLNPAFQEADVDTLREHLMRIGDSVVAVYDTDMVKIHVHTNVPGKALQMALRLGEINGVKIENMREQHRRLMEERKAREKELGMVAISVGEGLDKVFKDLAVDALVTGGQTMNPSASDIEKAIRKVNARNVLVFPNNKNIIMAAQQAAEMVEKSQKIHVAVVPTTSVTQGVAAVLAFDGESTLEANAKSMEAAANAVQSGSVTFAVRSTNFEGHHIDEGDYMAMVDGQLVSNGKEIDVVLDEMVEKMMEQGGDYITVFYGADVKEEEAAAFVRRLEERYPDADTVLQYGGQPLYYYFISVE
jgi:DAK2 domain fusion protein YloV